MKGVSRHYKQLSTDLQPTVAGPPVPGRIHTVVLVSNLLAPTLRALAYAQSSDPATLRAVHVAVEHDDDSLPREWRSGGSRSPSS